MMKDFIKDVNSNYGVFFIGVVILGCASSVFSLHGAFYTPLEDSIISIIWILFACSLLAFDLFFDKRAKKNGIKIDYVLHKLLRIVVYSSLVFCFADSIYQSATYYVPLTILDVDLEIFEISIIVFAFILISNISNFIRFKLL